MNMRLNYPLSHIQVTSPYGHRDDPPPPGVHYGIDFGYNDIGTPIYAAAPGEVTFASASNLSDLTYGYGYHVIIDHGGSYTLYAHMNTNPTNYVSVGQQVAAGQQIGVIGSTGWSTGPHLHFEFRLGGSDLSHAIDPQPYLDGKTFEVDGTKGITSAISSTGSYVSGSTVPYTPDKIVGRRLSSLATQPLHAFVEIRIGDVLLATSPAKPNIIQNFEINRLLSGTADTATFQLFDDNWEEIERILSDHWRNVHIRYGYVDSSLVSENYNMMLQDYSISFTSTGVILSISAISIGAVTNLNKITVTTGSSNPTTAAKAICRAAGYIVLDQNFDATLDTTEVYNLLNDLPVRYIINEIVPTAVTASGDYINFYIDSANYAYFKTSSFKVSANEDIKTFIYQKGYDSVVQDLTFDIKGVFGGTTTYQVASGVQSVFIDPTSKQEDSYTETTSSAAASVATTGDGQHISSDQSIASLDPAGYTSDQLRNRLSYQVKRDITSMYEATMTIIGDPTINYLDKVRIINVTDEGYLHHTSGIYMVTGIIDTIDGGTMTTSLKLLRNGDINDGVELVNPKELVK